MEETKNKDIRPFAIPRPPKQLVYTKIEESREPLLKQLSKWLQFNSDALRKRFGYKWFDPETLALDSVLKKRSNKWFDPETLELYSVFNERLMFKVRVTLSMLDNVPSLLSALFDNDKPGLLRDIHNNNNNNNNNNNSSSSYVNVKHWGVVVDNNYFPIVVDVVHVDDSNVWVVLTHVYAWIEPVKSRESLIRPPETVYSASSVTIKGAVRKKYKPKGKKPDPFVSRPLTSLEQQELTQLLSFGTKEMCFGFGKKVCRDELYMLCGWLTDNNKSMQTNSLTKWFDPETLSADNKFSFQFYLVKPYPTKLKMDSIVSKAGLIVSRTGTIVSSAGVFTGTGRGVEHEQPPIKHETRSDITYLHSWVVGNDTTVWLNVLSVPNRKRVWAILMKPWNIFVRHGIPVPKRTLLTIPTAISSSSKKPDVISSSSKKIHVTDMFRLPEVTSQEIDQLLTPGITTEESSRLTVEIGNTMVRTLLIHLIRFLLNNDLVLVEQCFAHMENPWFVPSDTIQLRQLASAKEILKRRPLVVRPVLIDHDIVTSVAERIIKILPSLELHTVEDHIERSFKRDTIFNKLLRYPANETIRFTVVAYCLQIDEGCAFLILFNENWFDGFVKKQINDKIQNRSLLVSHDIEMKEDEEKAREVAFWPPPDIKMYQLPQPPDIEMEERKASSKESVFDPLPHDIEMEEDEEKASSEEPLFKPPSPGMLDDEGMGSIKNSWNGNSSDINSWNGHSLAVKSYRDGYLLNPDGEREEFLMNWEDE